MNPILSLMNSTNTTSLLGFTQGYLYSLPGLILQGDFVAITISSIIFLVALFIVNKITSLMLILIKKTIFLLITGLAVYYLATDFHIRLLASGLTLETIVFGVFGVLIGLFGIFLSIKTWFSGAKESFGEIKYGSDFASKDKGLEIKSEDEQGIEKQDIITELKGLKNEFSLQMIKHDKNLLSVLVYLIIGQFGIFSSPTIAPPNPQLGLTFFFLFLFGAVIFVRQTYKNFRIGLLHLIIALFFGLLLSLILGYFWGGIELSTLFSFQYFGTSCVVAVITGMAVSLIMGGK